MNLPTDGIFVLPDADADPTGPYSLAEVRARLTEGRFDPALAVWAPNDGQEWRPVSELLPPMPVIQPQPEANTSLWSILGPIGACALILFVVISCQLHKNDPGPVVATAAPSPSRAYEAGRADGLDIGRFMVSRGTPWPTTQTLRGVAHARSSNSGFTGSDLESWKHGCAYGIAEAYEKSPSAPRR